MMRKLQCAQNKVIRYILNYNSRRQIGFRDFENMKMRMWRNHGDYLFICIMLPQVEEVTHSYNTEIIVDICYLNLVFRVESPLSTME